MKGIDFSTLKKVAQDKKSATFLHPDGHEVRIAVIGLSPEMKKKIAEFPLHQADAKAPVEATDTGTANAASPAPQAPPSPIPTPDSDADDDDEGGTAGNAAPQPNTQFTPAAAPRNAPVAPVASDNEVSVPQTGMTPEQEASALTQENLNFAGDMHQGQIKPKTYNDLWEEKSTPGKIGTLFGLLVAGAGSGLTGQPNAVLGMMDKQIQNDLEAQKQTQANKLNWYNAALAHQKTLAETGLQNQHALAQATETDKQRLINQQLGVADNTASTMALNNARAAAVNNNQLMINSMADGPAKVAAQNRHDNMVVPFFLNKITSDNLAAAQKNQATRANTPTVKSMPPPQNTAAVPGTRYDAYDRNRLIDLEHKGALNPALLNGATPQQLDAEAKAKQLNRNNWADWAASYQKMANLHGGNSPVTAGAKTIGTTLGTLAGLGAGLLTTGGATSTAAGAAGAGIGHQVGAITEDYFTRERAQELSALTSKLVANGMPQDTAARFADEHLPTWYDNEKTLDNGFNLGNAYFSNTPAEVTPTLDKVGVSYAAPKYSFVNPLAPKKKK